MEPKDILQLEASDTHQAYLFEENGHWYAFEHSANRIERFVRLCRLQAQDTRRLRAYKSRNRPRYSGQMFHFAMRRFNTCTRLPQ